MLIAPFGLNSTRGATTLTPAVSGRKTKQHNRIITAHTMAWFVQPTLEFDPLSGKRNMKFSRCTQPLNDIAKLQSTHREIFDSKRTYKIDDVMICDDLSLERKNELRFFRSSYSRYDSASVYYFLNGDADLIEFILGDEEDADALINLFRVIR